VLKSSPIAILLTPPMVYQRKKMSDHLHDTFGQCEDCQLESRLFGGLCEDCDEQMFATFWTGEE
jgi:hypothetical protein